MADSHTRRPWPNEESRLLRNQGEVDLGSANAAFQLYPSWATYRSAFEEAVRLLQPRASRDNDFVIFPLWFCGRHAVELGLKELTGALDSFLHHFGVQVPEAAKSLKMNHGLRQRWRVIEEMMEAAESAGATLDPGQPHFGRLVDELEEVDESSMRFRYPTTKGSRENGPEPHFTPGSSELPQIVSIKKLVEGFEAMFAYLTGAVDYFENAVEISESSD